MQDMPKAYFSFTLCEAILSEKFENAKKLINLTPQIDLNRLFFIYPKGVGLIDDEALERAIDMSENRDEQHSILISSLLEVAEKTSPNNSVALEDFIKFLKSKRFDFDSKNKAGKTYVQYLLEAPHGIEENYLAKIKRLVEWDATTTFDDGSTLYHSLEDSTANQACMDYLKSLSQGINQKNVEGITPLHAAIEAGEFKAAVLLIENGADVHAKDNKGNHLLHFFNDSCFTDFYKHTKPIFELLETKGFKTKEKINEKNTGGFTPLHTAIQRGDFAAACLLVKHGADFALTDSKGNNLLHLLATSEPPEDGWAMKVFIKLFRSKITDAEIQKMLDTKNLERQTPSEIMSAYPYYIDTTSDDISTCEPILYGEHGLPIGVRVQINPDACESETALITLLIDPLPPGFGEEIDTDETENPGNFSGQYAYAPTPNNFFNANPQNSSYQQQSSSNSSLIPKP
jgi:ankyrin repeat protein